MTPIFHITTELTNGVHFELDALVLLDPADDLEQVAGVRIARRSEHAHQTLGRLVREGAKLLEPDCGVDVVTQYDLAGIDVPCKQALDAFLQQPFAKSRSRSARACTVSWKSRVSGMVHIS